MFERFTTRTESKLEKPIDRLLSELETVVPGSPEYNDIMKNLKDLMEMRRNERAAAVSPDTLAMVVGNLLGILTIVAYEQKHVMVSKALGMVLRSKQST